MGLLSFFKDAGEKLFGKGQAQAAQQAAAADPASPEKQAAANAAAAKAIEDYIRAMNLDATGLMVEYDGSASVVTVRGIAPDQATREKIVLCCGNVAGVASVNDQLTVEQPVEESRWYTVKSGDTLSKIAKEHYGNANAYMQIFEANKPMLSHPDKIYPGQTLRIPPQA
jgi:nucleoid-associated protein YgaU